MKSESLDAVKIAIQHYETILQLLYNKFMLNKKNTQMVNKLSGYVNQVIAQYTWPCKYLIDGKEMGFLFNSLASVLDILMHPYGGDTHLNAHITTLQDALQREKDHSKQKEILQEIEETETLKEYYNALLCKVSGVLFAAGTYGYNKLSGQEKATFIQHIATILHAEFKRVDFLDANFFEIIHERGLALLDALMWFVNVVDLKDAYMHRYYPGRATENPTSSLAYGFYFTLRIYLAYKGYSLEKSSFSDRVDIYLFHFEPYEKNCREDDTHVLYKLIPEKDKVDRLLKQFKNRLNLFKERKEKERIEKIKSAEISLDKFDSFRQAVVSGYKENCLFRSLLKVTSYDSVSVEQGSQIGDKTLHLPHVLLCPKTIFIDDPHVPSFGDERLGAEYANSENQYILNKLMDVAKQQRHILELDIEDIDAAYQQLTEHNLFKLYPKKDLVLISSSRLHSSIFYSLKGFNKTQAFQSHRFYGGNIEGMDEYYSYLLADDTAIIFCKQTTGHIIERKSLYINAPEPTEETDRRGEPLVRISMGLEIYFQIADERSILLLRFQSRG